MQHFHRNALLVAVHRGIHRRHASDTEDLVEPPLAVQYRTQSSAGTVDDFRRERHGAGRITRGAPWHTRAFGARKPPSITASVLCDDRSRSSISLRFAS